MKGTLKLKVISPETKEALPILDFYNEKLDRIEAKLDRINRPLWRKIKDKLIWLMEE
jgi:hypothetical protein